MYASTNGSGSSDEQHADGNAPPADRHGAALELRPQLRERLSRERRSVDRRNGGFQDGGDAVERQWRVLALGAVSAVCGQLRQAVVTVHRLLTARVL